LTPLLLALWVSHRYRLTRWGAFSWGLVGAIIGQVHLSGWFVAFGLIVGTLIAERFEMMPRSAHWRMWLLGTGLGLLPAIPWLIELPGMTIPTGLDSTFQSTLGKIPGYLYGLVASATSALPYGFLGTGEMTDDLLIRPTVGGIRFHVYEWLTIYLIVIYAARIIATIVGAIKTTFRALRQRAQKARATDSLAPAPAGAAIDALERPGSVTRFYVLSAFVVPFVSLFLGTNMYFYHYFFVFCPFLFVMIAQWFLPWRRCLFGMVVAQALMTVAFLNYIHDTGGTDRGEYGVTFARQMAAKGR
jgi:hypothetical protein